MDQLLIFDNVKNPLGLLSLWVDVVVAGVKIVTIDWNNELAVKTFAVFADKMLRSGSKTSIKVMPLQ